MIQIEKINIHDIPVLHIAKSSLFETRIPTVVYYHGYNGEKESSLTIAYKIAEKGMRVILPDGHLHGEREGNISLEEKEYYFWEIILQTIDELAEIKTYLEMKQLVLPGYFGVGGTSMGGMITYGALRKYDWIKSAVVLMGSPYVARRVERSIDKYNKNAKEKVSDEERQDTVSRVENIDLTQNIDKLNERPLFIWHGEKDEILSVEDSRKFFNEIKGHYSNEKHIQFLEEKDRTHNISKLSMNKTADWFGEHLLFQND